MAISESDKSQAPAKTTVIIPQSGPRELTSGDLTRQRWASNIDIIIPDRSTNIFGLDTVIYGDGTTEITLPGSETYKKNA